VVTAQQIIADQMQIDSAVANVAVARQSLSYASLTTPIAGTVADVAITKAATVTAGSSTETITVVSPGQDEVSTTVSLGDIARLAVGDRTSVVVDGVSTPIEGTVSAIGIQDTASGGSTTFPVTIALDATKAVLFEGSGASVTVTAKSVTDVLTVPTSALHTTTTGSTVTVMKDGTESTVAVQVGAVGGELTQVTSGLTVGEQVVIADLATPLPDTTTTAATGRFAGGTGTRGGAAGGFGAGGGRRAAG
jgi:RND family efflux transporter MFP subunit